MKPTTFLSVVAVLSLSWVTPAQAENFADVSKLLSTRECPKCDLSNAGLVHANLAGVNLREANLLRANLSRAVLTGADLRGADLRGASLFGVDLTQADLTGAKLAGADLREANLAGANLTGTDIATANLKDALGVGNYAGKLENLYQWAIEEGQSKNYPAAIAYFNEALQIQPDFAPAYLGRAAARAEMGDYTGGMQDAQQASALYSTQGNAQGYQAAEVMTQQIKAYKERAEKGPKSGGNFVNMLGGLLLRVLF
jgi:uncharacterized protein YjbI with pentapeptide repeats